MSDRADEDTREVVMEPRDSIDVDSPVDLELAELLLSAS